MKIYLSPSNQPANKYAVGNTNEKVQMEAVAIMVQNKLKDYEVDTMMADFNKSINKSERPAEAAKSKCDFYLAIHSNATGSTPTAVGAVGLYHPNSEISKELSLVLVEELNAICLYKSNRWSSQINGMTGLNGGSYGEIRSPFELGIPSTLIEVNFHDNPQVAQWIIDNKPAIADAIVRGLVKVFNLQKKAVEEVNLDKPSDWAADVCKKAVEIGLVQGDGKGYYGWQEPLTLQRYLKLRERERELGL